MRPELRYTHGFPQETGMDLKVNVDVMDLVDLAHQKGLTLTYSIQPGLFRYYTLYGIAEKNRMLATTD